MLVTATAGGCTGTGVPVDAESSDGSPAEELAHESTELPWRALPASNAAVQAAMRLTASDGTGLRLVRLRARAVVTEPLAFTELHLVFDNPEDRTIEGQFTIDMPPGAAISRFAMRIGETWQEGEVVERQAARRTYEDFLHKKQDPALLENQSGNRFSARVFPIPARGRKELIVSYSQTISDLEEPYALMLAGLPELDELDVEIAVGEPQLKVGGVASTGGEPGPRKIIAVHERKWTPTENLVVRGIENADALGVRNGRHAVARVVASGSMAADPIESLTILFDTSASRSLDFAKQVRRLGALVNELRQVADDPGLTLRVVAFDQDVAIVFEGSASEFGQRELDALYTRSALGASDLEGALRRITSLDPTSRVLVMTDGIATAGLKETASLTEATRALERHGVQRVDAILDGGLQDRAALAAVTTSGLARDGVVIDGDLDATRILAKLQRRTLGEVEVEVPEATFVWPTTQRGLQAGDSLLVYAELPEDAAMSVIVEGDDRVSHDITWMPGERPLLARAIAGARIEEIAARASALPISDATTRGELQREIVRLSIEHRVLSDFTALLVLETQADYDRFGIAREALADVLTVGAGRVEVMQRHDLMLEARRAGTTSETVDAEMGRVVLTDTRGVEQPATQNGILGLVHADGGNFLSSPGDAFAVGNDKDDVWGGLTGTEIGESYGVGGLGLVGTGRGGGGTGEGTIGMGSGYGGRNTVTTRAVTTKVRLGKPNIRGDRDADLVRRVVRAHINEVRWCYERGLDGAPSLAGRVSVQFVIGPTGHVPVAVVSETSVASAQVGNCIARAVKRWRFPGGKRANAVVTYPFVLGSGEGVAPIAEPVHIDPDAVVAKAENPTYEGDMQEVMSLVDAGRHGEALVLAQAWHDRAPGDVLALVAMGEALEGLGATRTAARVYGSIIDLFPSRADLRRFAGYRLDRLPSEGRALAVDTYREALAQRPDHPNSHRLYAWALVRNDRLDEAFDAIMTGAERTFPTGRFDGVGKIMREDAGLIGAALLHADPSQRAHVIAALVKLGIAPASTPSTRFVMSWETDANDVDFHIYDGRGDHAYYGQRTLDSGGSLFADVTTGYGPECFAIDDVPSAFPYRFEANYYSRGPMGYGMGTLQLVAFDGEGTFAFDDRPFVIMKDHATVALGVLKQPLLAPATP